MFDLLLMLNINLMSETVSESNFSTLDYEMLFVWVDFTASPVFPSSMKFERLQNMDERK